GRRSSRGRGSPGGRCSGSPSATRGRPRTTFAPHGRSYEGRRHADRNDERHRGPGDRRGARRGLRPDRTLAQHRLAVRRRVEVDLRRRAEGDDEGARRLAPAGDRPNGRRGGSEGRERDRRHALRYLGDGLELDRDLRLWNGGAHQVRVTRAVVFDLWDTLVDFDVEGSIAVQTAMAKRLGRD